MDRGSLFLLLLCLFLLLPGNGPRILDEREELQLREYVQLKQYEAEVVRNASVTQSLKHINLTNALQAVPPPELSEQIQHLWNAEPRNQSVFYGNLSSVLHGRYRRTGELAPQKMPLPSVFRDLKVRNRTTSLESRGKVGLMLRESGIEPGLMAGELVLDNANTFDLQGVYLDSGHIVMSTRSLKFAGPLAIPWILPTQVGAEHAKQVAEYIAAQSAESIEDDADYERLEAAARRAGTCELVLVGHVRSAGLTQAEMDAIEKEIKHPLGRPLPRLPPIRIESVVYSPDCGLSLHVKTFGERLEFYQGRVRRVFTGIMVSLLAIAVLLSMQMKATSTPSTVSRVSFWTVALMALVDGSICIVALTVTSEPRLFLARVGVALCSFALITICELRYMISIYYAQLNEAAAEQRVQNLPTTTIAEVPPEREIERRIFTMYYTGLLCFVFFTLWVLRWNDQVRSTYETTVVVIIYSYWVPQIYRSARRGHLKPLLPIYIVGVSTLRLVPALYFCFYRQNVGYHHYAPTLGWFLLGWQWLQVLVLLAQYTLGPRFFIPGSMITPLYDYHPIITTDVEQGLPTEAPPTADPELQLPACTHKQVDCAICMMPVDLIVVDGEQPPPAALLERRKYMVTPCRHVFHSECLEKWMQSRMECPICRGPLPPI